MTKLQQNEYTDVFRLQSVKPRLLWIFRSGIAGLNGRSIFSFWRNFPAACQSGWTNLYPSQLTRVSLLKHLLFVLLIISILTRMRWYLSVVWIHVFLMTNDTEHLTLLLYLSSIFLQIIA